MRKDEFVSRVGARIAAHGQTFSASLLKSWTHHALIPPANRLGNVGTRPQFVYGAKHYRRCLQIFRFRRLGARRLDSIHVALFAAGYSEPVPRVRKAFLSEFERLRRSLVSKLKTEAAYSWDDLSNRRSAALKRNLGKSDFRFRQAKLVLPFEEMVKIVRWVLVGSLGKDREKIDPEKIPETLKFLPIDFLQTALNAAKPHFEYLLADGKDDGPSRAAQELSSATANQFLMARSHYWMFRKISKNIAPIFGILGFLPAQREKIAAAFGAIDNSLKAPEWRMLLLFLGLQAQKITFEPSEALDEKILRAAQEAEKSVEIFEPLDIIRRQFGGV